MTAELPARHTFRGIPRSLAVTMGTHSIRLTNSTARDLGSDILLYSEPDDAVAIIYQLDDLPAHDLWLDGRHHRIKAVPRSTMHIQHLDAYGEARLGPTFDSINVHIPRVALKAFAEMSGSPKADGLAVGAEWSTVDPVMNSLAPGLRLALSDPNSVSRLVQEHLTFALVAHLATTYGTMKTDPGLMPGRLASWQVRRAKEHLAANLSSEVSLAEVSQSCHLSPSHFSRVFKATTGRSPFAWRQWYRIEVAKQMLRQPETSVAEIALACGFSDQSHFTRAFSRRTGSTPTGWRRGGGC